jgi:hypothetical protein
MSEFAFAAGWGTINQFDIKIGWLWGTVLRVILNRVKSASINPELEYVRQIASIELYILPWNLVPVKVSRSRAGRVVPELKMSTTSGKVTGQSCWCAEMLRAFELRIWSVVWPHRLTWGYSGRE